MVLIANGLIPAKLGNNQPKKSLNAESGISRYGAYRSLVLKRESLTPADFAITWKYSFVEKYNIF